MTSPLKQGILFCEGFFSSLYIEDRRNRENLYVDFRGLKGYYHYILPTSSIIRNVWRPVRRIGMLTQSLKGINTYFHQILPTCTMRNVWRLVMRTFMLISRLNGCCMYIIKFYQLVEVMNGGQKGELKYQQSKLVTHRQRGFSSSYELEQQEDLPVFSFVVLWLVSSINPP